MSIKPLPAFGPIPCAALALTLLLSACGGSSAPGPEAGGNTASSGSAAPAAAPADRGPEPQTVAEIFPPGEGRTQLLNNCSSCHNLACSAIGQRTADRWASLKESHSDKIGKADLDAIFSYLQTNFSDAQPEPDVPARFLEGACTPF